MVYELKVTLKDVGVPVWRKILIEEETTFAEMHHILQIAFQWESSHLHTYRIEKSDGEKMTRIEIAPEDLIEDSKVPSLFQIEQYDEEEEFLDDWFIKVNDQVTYIYDFGDDWQHVIVLTKIIEDHDGADYPICVGAKNLAPEEDGRFEVISGMVDLNDRNSQEIIDEINEEFEDLIEDFSLENMIDFWPDTFELAKEFQQLKPWEIITDDEIFGVLDPFTGQMMYCSILGNAEEMYGLAVYKDVDGYYMLTNMIHGEMVSHFNILQYQNSLLLSFEDREDLEKEEYKLIKTYEVPFRGKKSWPSFRSFKPGYYPWFMDGREARGMTFALHEALHVVNEVKNGLDLPHMVEDDQLLVRIPSENDDLFNFESKLVPVENLEALTLDISNEISELDMKRVSKINNLLSYQIEYVIAHVDFPIIEGNDENERPQFPIITMAIDLEGGRIIEHDLGLKTPEPIESQMMFISMIQKLNGKPSSIITNYKTALIIAPVLEDLGIDLEVVHELPMTSKILDDLIEDLANNLD